MNHGFNQLESKQLLSWELCLIPTLIAAGLFAHTTWILYQTQLVWVNDHKHSKYNKKHCKLLFYAAAHILVQCSCILLFFNFFAKIHIIILVFVWYFCDCGPLWFRIKKKIGQSGLLHLFACFTITIINISTFIILAVLIVKENIILCHTALRTEWIKQRGGHLAFFGDGERVSDFYERK